MANRKKRMQKGLESLEKQVKIHEQKKEEAEKMDKKELAGYYEKEIESKKRDIEKKKRILEKI